MSWSLYRLFLIGLAHRGTQSVTPSLLGINPNGLLLLGRLTHILDQASRTNVDILLLAARRAGYAACVGYVPEAETRGGTAIFAPRSTLDLGSGHLAQTSWRVQPMAPDVGFRDQKLRSHEHRG